MGKADSRSKKGAEPRVRTRTPERQPSSKTETPPESLKKAREPLAIRQLTHVSPASSGSSRELSRDVVVAAASLQNGRMRKRLETGLRMRPFRAREFGAGL